jgi:hypothetical protein
MENPDGEIPLQSNVFDLFSKHAGNSCLCPIVASHCSWKSAGFFVLLGNQIEAWIRRKKNKQAKGSYHPLTDCVTDQQLQLERPRPPASIPNPSFFHIHNRFYLALCSHEHAEVLAKHELSNRFLVVSLKSHKNEESDTLLSSEDSEGCFKPCSLSRIFKFDKMATSLERKSPSMRLVFCTGHDQTEQVSTALLLGCHMIMSHGCGFEETNLAFKYFHSKAAVPSDSNNVSIQNCWRAVCQAKCRNWIDLESMSQIQDECVGAICMQEYLHYAR